MNRIFETMSVLIQIPFDKTEDLRYALEGQVPKACIDIDNFEAPPSSEVLSGGHISRRRLAGSWLFFDYYKQKVISGLSSHVKPRISTLLFEWNPSMEAKKTITFLLRSL